MCRSRGYAFVGEKLHIRGVFKRTSRVSLLCFIGVDGLLECYQTDGTFTRAKFVENCRNFAISSKKVQQHPGKHSIWIMDGAKIHCDASFIEYLRSIGIIPLFLPPYCPFYNPIELMFGQVKIKMKRFFKGVKSHAELNHQIAKVIATFAKKSFKNEFRKCGYTESGIFNPGIGLEQPVKEYGFVRNE